jgi:hypothetical protein
MLRNSPGPSPLRPARHRKLPSASIARSSWLPAFATYTPPAGRGIRLRTRNNGDEPVLSPVYMNAESRSACSASGQSSTKMVSGAPTPDRLASESAVRESDPQLAPARAETSTATNADTFLRSPPGGPMREVINSMCPCSGISRQPAQSPAERRRPGEAPVSEVPCPFGWESSGWRWAHNALAVSCAHAGGPVRQSRGCARAGRPARTASRQLHRSVMRPATA